MSQQKNLGKVLGKVFVKNSAKYGKIFTFYAKINFK